MQQFPIALNLKHRPCLVVGGGEIAARKIALLLRAEAQIIVVAPELCEKLRNEQDKNTLIHHARGYRETDIDGMVLVIAATADRAINEQVSKHAMARNVPVNVVDQPDLCSFTVPSIVDRDPVIIGISTGGASPVLARLLRSRLEAMIPATYGRMARLAERFRTQVKQRFPTTDRRRYFWEQVLQGPIAEMFFSGKENEAEQALVRAIDSADAKADTGEVYLVGAGPGDPDLLTFRALRLMQQADVVLYDRLVSPEILELTRREAERIYVGKERSNHAVPQPSINKLLVEHARQGKRVLRLKGGDPFIFGRGGEEIGELADAGIPFQVVPGITAASGCAAYAGMPLTHRDHAQSCIFVTGHLKDGSMDLNFDVLAQPQQTVVIYMGLTGLEVLCRELINHGAPADRPAALVEQGTTQAQRVITGTLDTLAKKVEAAEVRAPTLVIVGDVVKLHDKLAWFHPDLNVDNNAQAGAGN